MRPHAITPAALLAFFAVVVVALPHSVYAQSDEATQRRVIRRVKKKTTTTTTQTTSTPSVERYVRHDPYRRHVSVPRRVISGDVVYFQAPTYQPPSGVYITPNYRYYNQRPQVFRYLRRPRYVWVPYQEDLNPSQTVYVYDNSKFVIEEKISDDLPELDCPRNTTMRRAAHQTWCATDRGTKHGPYVTYYSNGQVRTEGYYEYGKRNGAWIEYYKDGGVRTEGDYRDGKRAGTWTNFNKDGEELTSIFYNE